MKKIYLCLAAFFLIYSHSFSQAEFRSNVAAGNWNVAGSWTMVSGVDGDGVPDADDDVYVQSGHAITLTGTEACKVLSISTGTADAITGAEGAIILGTNSLELNGNIRCYFAAVGTTPGNSSTAGYDVYPFSGTGTVRVVGNSRPLTVAGEWSGAITNPATGTFNLTVNMNALQTLTLATDLTSTALTVSTGTFDLSTFTYGLDNGNAGQGNAVIATGAIIASSASAVNIFQRNATSPAGTLTVNPGGKLLLTGADPKIQMVSYNLSGTVEYGGGNQTWADKGTDATTPGNVPILYTNVTLSNSGVKTSVAGSNLQVLGTLSLQGTASFVWGTGGSLQYFPGSTVEYAGTSAQTSTDAEFPGTSGPANLTINNASGVTLHATRTIASALTFADGNISLGTNNLTIGSAIGYGITKHVITDNSGKLFFPNIGAVPTVFPIGSTALSYNPVTVSNGTNIAYGARVVTGLPLPIFIGNNAVNKTWFVEAATTPAATINVDFSYSAGDGNPGFNYTAAVDHGVYTTGWNINQTGLIPTGSYQVATSVGSFVGGTELPMVIGNLGSILSASRLVTLSAQKLDNSCMLNWEIGNAGDIKEIILERSADGRNFETVVRVSSSTEKYNDNNLLSGRVYYRLKVTDANGKVAYSNIAAVINSDGGFEIVSIAPSIASSGLQVNMALAKKTAVTVVITDATGRAVQRIVNTAVAGSNLLNIDVSKLAVGIYYLTAATAQGETKTVRFVKQ